MMCSLESAQSQAIWLPILLPSFFFSADVIIYRLSLIMDVSFGLLAFLCYSPLDLAKMVWLLFFSFGFIFVVSCVISLNLFPEPLVEENKVFVKVFRIVKIVEDGDVC